VVNPHELMMNRDELAFWGRVRRRGAFWYVVNKGLFFLLLYPAVGHLLAGWALDAQLFLEAWLIGLACGGFVWMRKELRFRFTFREQGRLLPDGTDD